MWNKEFDKLAVLTGQPIAKHHPLTRKSIPNTRRTDAVLVPPLDPTNALKSSDDSEIWALETYEWLGLVSLQSPRILADDSIDSFLSRYKIPDHTSRGEATNLRVLTWKGLIPATWVRSLIIELRYVVASDFPVDTFRRVYPG